MLRSLLHRFPKIKIYPAQGPAGTLGGTHVNAFKSCAYFKVF